MAPGVLQVKGERAIRGVDLERSLNSCSANQGSAQGKHLHWLDSTNQGDLSSFSTEGGETPERRLWTPRLFYMCLLLSMFLVCGGKLECPRRTQACTGRTPHRGSD